MPKLLREARQKLARASVCFESEYQEREFSLCGERTRELIGEARAWLDEYIEEVGSYPVVDSDRVSGQNVEPGTGRADEAAPGW